MILITGAGGFIASYLIDELIRRNERIIAVDIIKRTPLLRHYKIPYYQIDIRRESDIKKISSQSIDCVIDLACLQPANVRADKYDPREYIRTNVIGRLNILEFARKNNVNKYIYTISHRNTAGFWHKNKPIKEKDGKSLKYTGEYSIYSISESAAVDCVEHYMEQYGIRGVVLRLPPVYGYGPHGIIYKNGKPIITGFKSFIDNASSGKTIEIWGDPTIGRDIIYVKDVVAAILKVMHNKKAAGLYNIASGYRLTLDEQVKTIIKIFSKSNKKSIVKYFPEKYNYLENYVYDISKAKKELNWFPKYNFEQMLIDYKKESGNKRFNYLVIKRKNVFNK